MSARRFERGDAGEDAFGVIWVESQHLTLGLREFFARSVERIRGNRGEPDVMHQGCLSDGARLAIGHAQPVCDGVCQVADAAGMPGREWRLQIGEIGKGQGDVFELLLAQELSGRCWLELQDRFPE